MNKLDILCRLFQDLQKYAFTSDFISTLNWWF